MLHFYAVERLVFYALFECDDDGAHVCGFFSRDTEQPEQVLWDLVVLPPYEGMAYGQFMISLSYELACRAGVPGGPYEALEPRIEWEFKKYQRKAVAQAIQEGCEDPREIATRTGIREQDVIDVLECSNGFATVKSRSTFQLQPDMLVWRSENRRHQGAEK
jgi:hypothetical protein